MLLEYYNIEFIYFRLTFIVIVDLPSKEVYTRDAHFLEENQETGNKGPGNFLQEMKDQENQEKS